MVRIAFDPVFCHPLPEGHRFPMEKYELIPAQLLWEGTITESQLFHPAPVEAQWVLQAHTEAYWEDLLHLRLSPKMIRKIGLPLSAELVYRERVITQGTIDCTRYALENGVALNVAGGTHHAYADRGEGFCLLNDVAVAARYLLVTDQSRKILIIDLDVHQGNGTAAIFRDDPRVFTFSMHGKENYPLHKELSDLDVEWPTGTGDEPYLARLRELLPALIRKEQPDFLFFVSGVDVLASDKLGKLGMSPEGCRERDRLVFSAALESGLPLVVTMGGGYSPRLKDIVEAHCNTFRLAEALYGDGQGRRPRRSF